MARSKFRSRGRVKGILGVSAAAVIAAMWSPAAFAAQSGNSRLLAAQCAQCHGTNGYSVGGIESLAGEEYFDLLDELIDMSRPGETGDIMKHQAKGYTRNQMKLIADYFASLPKAR